jgi:hypothetical protein
MLGTVRRLCCWAALAGLWMPMARLCGLCAGIGDCPRVCTRLGYPGESTSSLRTGICTAGAVTGGVAVPKVFETGWCTAGVQRLERCRIRVVSSLT